MTTVMAKMTLTSAGRQGANELPPKPARWLARSHARRPQFTPRLTESCQSLYISRTKGENRMLGHRILDWTDEQKRKIHEARMQGRQVKPHRYRAGTVALTRHPPLPGKTTALLIRKAAFSEAGEGDRPGFQDRPAVPVSGDTVSPGGGGGIPCQAV